MPSTLRLRRCRAFLALALLCSIASSCRLAESAVDLPGKVLGGPAPPAGVPPNLVQLGVMRFADTFASEITQATRDFAAKVGTPAGRIQAMSWSVGQNTAAFTIATGANPHANLLDMVVLVTLGRMVHEEHFLPVVWGEADRPMLEAYRKLEEEIWTVASELLTPEQQQAVRTTLAEWHEKNPDMAVTAFVRLPAFHDMLAASRQSGRNVLSELSNLVSLDPLSGLEPTTREIEQTRLFAERTLYYLQRMQLILPVQAELLAVRLTELPAVGAALSDTERISLAAKSLAETAAALPETLRTEREAAVKQVSDELTLQRQGLVRDLESAEAPAQQVLGEARETLVAAERMSTALEGAIRALDGFVGRFQKEEGTAETQSSAESAEKQGQEQPTDEPKKPFDIGDYGDTATRIGAAADELTELIATLDKSLPEAQRLMDEVALRGERTIDHAFARGLALGAALIALVALAVLAVRRISARWPPKSVARPGS